MECERMAHEKTGLMILCNSVFVLKTGVRHDPVTTPGIRGNY